MKRAIPNDLSVGAFADRAGGPVSTIHFYEAEGLIESWRTPANHRRYDRRELRRVAIARVAQSVGVPLAEVAQTVRASYYGEEVMRLQRGRHEVKLMVRYPKEERRTIAAFDEIVAVLGLEAPEADVDVDIDVSALAEQLSLGAEIATIDDLVDARNAARSDRDWATADAIRDALEALRCGVPRLARLRVAPYVHASRQLQPRQQIRILVVDLQGVPPQLRAVFGQ